MSRWPAPKLDALKHRVAGDVARIHPYLMYIPNPDVRQIAQYIRRQVDNCLEVAHSVPNHCLLDSGPRETWLAIAGALDAVANEIEAGAHCNALNEELPTSLVRKRAYSRSSNG